MSDKFKTNFLIALPAAITTIILYVIIGESCNTNIVAQGDISYVKIIPYLAVLGCAIAGLNVLLVLPIGIILTGIIGICTSSMEFSTWLSSMTMGISSMSETILIALLAGGMLMVIRTGGGIDWIIRRLIRHSNNRKSAELSMAVLVSATNLCTANNTVAILSVGSIAKDISQKFDIDPKRTASILDTFSCFVQGIIPYGAQLLIASGLSQVAATSLMPYLYYPYILGAFALISILTGFPKTKKRVL